MSTPAGMPKVETPSTAPKSAFEDMPNVASESRSKTAIASDMPKSASEAVPDVASEAAPKSPTPKPIDAVAPAAICPAAGCGLQVVTLTNKHTYKLDEKALERILMRDDIKDLPVVVVSVAGAYRGGKSFLLDFFLRYLNAPESSRNESGAWLGDENKPLTGFSWRGGSERHTTGIVMWSEPFVCKLPTGEEVAVLLLDTQGTFDSSSTMRDCSTIFALSTLLASVQIYNIFNKFKEDDLQHLQLFTEYGKLVYNREGGKAFQTLEFLIRDWQYPYDHPFGLAGGNRVLERWLDVTPDMKPEPRDLRQHIRSCFEKTCCFLMPHPGFDVLKPEFDGRLSGISLEFKTALLELVPSIFAPTKLIPKTLNGEQVTAQELMTYFKSYMKIFNSDDTPSPMSIMKATSEAAMLSAVREAKALYEREMEQKCGKKQPSWPSVALLDNHNKAVEAARQCFINKKKLGTNKDSESYLAQLTKEVEDRLQDYVFMNEGKVLKAVEESKKKFESHITAVHGKNMLCLHPADLEIVLGEALLEASRMFDSQRKQFINIKDEERMKFLEGFGKSMTQLRNDNDKNNRLVVSEIRNTYSSAMGDLCNRDPPLDEDEYLKEHEKELAKAVQTFDSKRNRSSNRPEDPYKTGLREKLLQSYTQMSTINRSKNRKALQQSITLYDNTMKLFWDPSTCCLHPADLEEAHKNAKAQALDVFHPHQGAGEDYEKLLLSQVMEFKYRDLKEVNESANRAAVQEAYNVYYWGMSEDTPSNWWWLIVIPMLVYKTKKTQYHNKNKDAAIAAFYKKRRDSSNLARDPYYEDLIEKIDEGFKEF